MASDVVNLVIPIPCPIRSVWFHLFEFSVEAVENESEGIYAGVGVRYVGATGWRDTDCGEY